MRKKRAGKKKEKKRRKKCTFVRYGISDVGCVGGWVGHASGLCAQKPKTKSHGCNGPLKFWLCFFFPSFFFFVGQRCLWLDSTLQYLLVSYPL